MGVLVPTGSVGVKVNHGFTVSVSENRYKKYGAPQLDFIFTAGSIENVVTSENPISFVRNSPATFYDSSGILRTVSANEPRFDHNPVTGEKLGLLIEESRDQLVRDSIPKGLGGGGGWSQRANTKVGFYQGVSPDGNFTATSVIPNSGSTDYAYVTNNLASPTASECVASTYAKPINGLSSFVLRTRVGSGGIVYNFNFGTGAITLLFNTVTPAFTPVPFMETLSNGWFRCGFTSPAGTDDIFLNARESWSGSQPAGDGVTGMLFWGAQVEEGTFKTSLIHNPPTFISRASEATFYNENGIVSTASTDVARDDAYFPDENGNLISAELLLESAATNLLLHSEQFGLYSPSEVDVRPNNNLAPDLSFTAGSIVETTATDYHQLFLYPIQATGNITVSGFIKNKQGTRNALLKFNDGTNDLGFYFNPSSGNTVGVLTGAGTTEPINYGSQKLGNDWYRIYVSGNVSSTGGIFTSHHR